MLIALLVPAAVLAATAMPSPAAFRSQEPPPAYEPEIRAWIESGEPLAPLLDSVDEEPRAAAARAVATADRLPVDWRAVLRFPEVGRALALRLAHDGLPPETDYPALARELEAASRAAEGALVAAAALAPERCTGRPALGGEARQRALDRVLRQMLQGEDVDSSEVLFERARGAVGARELERIADALASEQRFHRRRALSLLLGAPYPSARPFLLELLQNPELPADLRGPIAERVIAAEGRAGAELALDQLGPETDEAFFRRVLIHVQDLVGPADHARLRDLAENGPSEGRNLALQLWARHETDPERRLVIFQHVVRGPARYLGPGLDALARRGPDAGIAASLSGCLDGMDRDLREMAVVMLPTFGDPEAVRADYEERLAQEPNAAASGPWACALAFTPSQDSRVVAARWLFERGWKAPLQARRVIAGLAGSDAMDPYLADFLHREEVPESLRHRLALVRVHESPEARSYLRAKLETESSVLLANVVETLSSAEDPQDAALLWDLARDPGFDATARAAAVRGLTHYEGAAGYLREWLAEPPQDYELAEAWVEAALRVGAPDLRRAVLEKVEDGWGPPDHRLALRLAAWRAQAAEPRADEAEALAAQLVALLEADRDSARAARTPIPDPRALAGEYPELDRCARALVAAAAGRPPAALAAWDPAGIPPAPLLFAAALLADGLPTVSARWSEEVASRADLPEAARVRALATWARAARDQPSVASAEALKRLLEAPWLLRAYPWDLEYGLAGTRVRGWVIPADRLCEWQLLSAARNAPAERAGRSLEALLDDYADPVVLQDASELALELPGGEPLAVALARRAWEWAPALPGPRLQLARALERAGDPEALEVYRSLLDLPLASADQEELARAGMERTQGLREAAD